MKYKLAKELNEAGFDHPCAKWEIEEGRLMTDEEYKEAQRGLLEPEKLSRRYGRTSIQYPTLSELIEACGDGFSSLKRFELWTAYGKADIGVTSGEGETPEEAVARLYIALNKK